MTFSGKIGDHPPRPTLPDSPTSGVDPDGNNSMLYTVKNVSNFILFKVQNSSQSTKNLSFNPTQFQKSS